MDEGGDFVDAHFILQLSCFGECGDEERWDGYLEKDEQVDVFAIFPPVNSLE